MAAQTHLFRCLQDNYGVLVHDPSTGATASIDAPEAAPVEAALKATGWRLSDILVTHHHADHTGGIVALKERHRCRVTAPKAEAKRIPAVDVEVADGDEVKVGNLKARVLETPGHTAGHISYWLPDDQLAFVGDTLFSIGCGRVIEGTPEMMWASLLKLRALPDDDPGLLRSRIHCRQYPLRQDGRAQQQRPGGARTGGCAALGAGQADDPVAARGREKRERVSACRCPGGCIRGRPVRTSAG